MNKKDIEFILKMEESYHVLRYQNICKYLSNIKDFEMYCVFGVKSILDYQTYIEINNKEVRKIIRRDYEKIIGYTKESDPKILKKTTESIRGKYKSKLNDMLEVVAFKIHLFNSERRLVHEILGLYSILSIYFAKKGAIDRLSTLTKLKARKFKIPSEEKRISVQELDLNMVNSVKNIANLKRPRTSINAFIVIYLIINTIMITVVNISHVKRKLERADGISLLNIQFGMTIFVALFYMVCMFYRNIRIKSRLFMLVETMVGLAKWEISQKQFFEFILITLERAQKLNITNLAVAITMIAGLQLDTDEIIKIIICITKTDVINAITGKSKSDELKKSLACDIQESIKIVSEIEGLEDIFLRQIVITNKISVTAIYSGISILVMLIVGFIKKISIKNLGIILLISIVMSVIQYIIVLSVQSTGLVKFKDYMDY